MLKEYRDKALFMKIKGIPRQLDIQILIEQDFLLINVPLSNIAYSLETILLPRRVKSIIWFQGLVLGQSIVLWYPRHVNSFGLSNSLGSLNLGRLDI